MKRNILHIHPDSMDGRVMGCAGHPAAHTPNLDRLAAAGTLFQNAYTNCPVCCPSRASMRSGLLTHNCEAWNNYKGLEEGDRTYDSDITDAGYRVTNLGRTDYISGQHTIRARVDAWTRTANIARPAYNEPAPRVIEEDTDVAMRDWQRTDECISWLRENSGGDKPFKLYLGFSAPHPPFTTSRKYLDLIDPDAVTVPSRDEENHPVVDFCRQHLNWQHGYDDDTMRLVRRIYYAMVAEVDAMVGCVLNTLSELGLDESTDVLFSSDHGEMTMDHHLWYKMSPYEGAMRIPMIFRGPSIETGKVIDTPVSLIDLYPTFMDMTGAKTNVNLDGHSLAAHLGKCSFEGASGKDNHPGHVVSAFHDTPSNASWFMLREGDWKYVWYAGYPPQLFNVTEDPGELVNRVASDPGKLKEMDSNLRAIVDVDEAAARILAYEKKSFSEWREQELAGGTYRDNMARVFSGWDRVEESDIKPWTDADERKITEWLAATS